MREWAGKRYWLVGASEGLGRALAHSMSRAGIHLILSARNGERLTELAAELPGPTKVVPCDIADTASVRAAASEIGAVDGVVLMAGVYWPQSSRDWDADSVIAMCDINLTGIVRVLGEVVPQMVARGAGHIVITASVAGFRGLPNAIGYGASKAACLSLAETMYADLRGTGVDVQVVNPGFIRTRLTDQNDFAMPFIMEPEAAARVMFDFMGTRRFKRSFPTAFALMLRSGLLMPDWLYFSVLGRATGR